MYNKEFNQCDMAEYLISNGKNYINNSQMVSMRDFISKFNRPDFNTVLDVDRFITSNKRFDVKLNNTTYKDVLPYYAIFIEHSNGLPGNGFFDAFMTQNRKVYDTLALNVPSSALNLNQMESIVAIAQDALSQHLKSTFPTSIEINTFIADMKNKNKCRS